MITHNLNMLDCKVSIGKDTVIENINITMEAGKCYSLSAPNGTGKTSLLLSFFKKKGYNIEGTINLGEKLDFNSMTTYDLSSNLFHLVLQSSFDIPSVRYIDMWTYMNEKFKCNDLDFVVKRELKKYSIDQSLPYKNIGECSMGERKMLEMIPLLFFKMKFIFLDEIDSGMDNSFKKNTLDIIKRLLFNNSSIFIISHNNEFLSAIKIEKSFTIESKQWKAI